jgi:hypothetical protein
MRTKLSTCQRKRRFPSREEAIAATGGLALLPYRCDRGDHFHLTSRTKGKKMPRAGRTSPPAHDLIDRR